MGMALRIGRTIRNAPRLQHILRVLVRHGFEDVVREVGIDRLFDRVRRAMGRGMPDAEFKRLPYAVRLRHVMESLGGTFIKLGQVLSTRPDLIPAHWAEEFRKLQDDVPPVAFEHIRERLEQEFPEGVDSVLGSIEEKAIAAGSIAQVHRATLPDGTPIVLKVARPGIRRQTASDLELLALLAEFVEHRFSDLGYSPMKVVEQFHRELTREMDLHREGRSTDRLRRAFLDNDQVIFPKVYWQATTENVLALEWIDGVRLSRMEEGDLSDDELRAVVANGADAVFRQCLEVGFFHADPHPGNIIAMPGGRICFIDCGMTGHIDPQTAERLADLVQGVVSQDMPRVITAAIELGDADPALVQDRSFRADAWEFISRFQTTALEELDIGDMLNDFFDKVRRHNLQCPADLVFLIKAITTIEGVGEQVYPDFDLVTHVRPHIERLVKRRYGFGAVRRRLRDGLLGYAQLAEELPTNLHKLLYDLRRNRITVNLEHSGFESLIRTVEHASRNIAHSMFIAALILGPSILILADSLADERSWLTTAGLLGYAGAGLLVVGRFIVDRLRSR